MKKPETKSLTVRVRRLGVRGSLRVVTLVNGLYRDGRTLEPGTSGALVTRARSIAGRRVLITVTVL